MVRTLRGVVAPGQAVRLIMDDGRYQHGYKVKSLVVWAPLMSRPGASEGFAVLSYVDVAPTSANAANAAQFGWANWSIGSQGATSDFAVLDPDHVIQQDAYIHSVGASLSYLIEIEPIDMTPPQAVLQLVKAQSQS